MAKNQQRKHYFSLARKSFKNCENIKRKWEVLGQNGRVGISAMCGLTKAPFMTMEKTCPR